MRIWCDIYTPDGSTLTGDGPIFVIKNASVTRALDGAGSFSLGLSGTDERAVELARHKYRTRIYIEENDVIRELGRGVIEKLDATPGDASWNLTVTGPDDMTALRNKSLLIARLYSEMTLGDVLEDVVSQAGWTTDGSALTDLISVRFDGDSVLKGIQYIVQEQGIHFRLGDTVNTIDVGPMGDDSGLFCINVEHLQHDAYDNDEIAIISQMSVSEDSNDVVNWLLPLGGGEGEATLTLQYSTRTSPYTIQTTTGPDGRTLYYISDTDSITTYGQVEKVGTFKNVVPLSNSDADLENAANALYDSAVAWLERHKDKFDVYSLSLKKVPQTIKAGQKIHVKYKGVINAPGGLFTYRDLDDDLWVLEVTENVTPDNISVDLKVATVDRYEQDTVNIIIGALESIELRNIRVQPYPSTRSYVYDREIAPGFEAIIPIRITDSTLTVQRVSIRFKTSPFRATATGSASGGGSTSGSGGDHSHRMYASLSTDTGVTWVTKIASARTSAGGSTATVQVAIPNVASYSELWTESSSGTHTHTTPNHTHALSYGIQDDTDTPTTIHVYVNGVDRTSPLGGPWAGSPGEVTVDLDPGLITGYIVNDAGGLRQEHTVEIHCLGGQGRAEIQVEIYETVQSIAVI